MKKCFVIFQRRLASFCFSSPLRLVQCDKSCCMGGNVLFSPTVFPLFVGNVSDICEREEILCLLRI